MRTLVLGIPLPHVTFDNYSFLSAPSLGEYQRLIVHTEAISTAISEVNSGSGDHRTFAGQLLANVSTTASTFGLSDLLKMRRREAEWFLSRGGVLVCFAYPDVEHTDIDALPGWRRYSWLPSPPGFSYTEHLLPGFGTPGAALTDESCPFAPYVTGFATRIAYRATIDESAPDFSDYARVFVRSTGGAAIGTELRVLKGHVVLVPPLARWDADRSAIARTLLDCLERWRERFQAKSPTPPRGSGS